MNAPAALSEFEENIVRNVREHGCHINFIFDPDGNDPDFGYSVGFPETVGQPEVVIFGLRREVAQFAINETLRQCRGGLVLEDWTRVDGLLNDHACICRTVQPEFIVRDYFNSAMWYSRYRTGHELDRAVQLVWPGAVDGFFPWDTDCAQIVRDYQPALYEQEQGA